MYGKLFKRNSARCQQNEQKTSFTTSVESAVLNPNVNISSSSSKNQPSVVDGLNVKKTSIQDIPSHNCKRAKLATSSESCTNEPRAPPCNDWLSFIISQRYQNWLKVNLALRLVCEFVSPIVDEIVKNMHKHLLKKHLHKINNRKKNSICFVPNRKDFGLWINDVLMWHRQPPSIKQVFRISNVLKWPEKDGAWEIARVFMSKRDRPSNSGNTVFAFNMSHTIRFVQRCKIVEDYVRDSQNIKRLSQVSNDIFNNPTLEIDNKTLLSSFDAIFCFIKDKRLFNYVEQYLEADELIKSVEQLRYDCYGHISSAKHSFNILKDPVYNGADGKTHPAENTITILQKSLSGLLSIPFPVQSECNTLSTTESEDILSKNFTTRAQKQFQMFDEKESKIIQQISNFCDNQEKSEVTQKTSFPSLSCEPTKQISISNFSLSSESECSEALSSDEDSENDEQSIRLTALVQGSVSNHSSKCLQCKQSFPQYSMSERLVSTGNEFHPSESVKNVMKLGLPTSNSLFMIPSEIEEPNVIKKEISSASFPTERFVKAEKEKNGIPNIFGPIKPNDLILLPTKGSGGSGQNFSYKSKLQRYLLKQPGNPGALFTVELDNNGNYFCSVTFQSNYAISSQILSYSDENAKEQAALKAKQWILGDGHKTDKEAARSWFDAYAVQVVGCTPIYTCTKISSSFYKSHVQVISNKFFQPDETITGHRVLISANCISSKPDIDVESSVIKSALQEIKIPVDDKNDNRKLLNEYCMANGGTFPVIHTSAIWHSKSEKMSWESSLKSFITRSLSQDIEHTNSSDVKKCFSSRDGCTILPVSSDFISAESSQIHKTRNSAEESAASNLLEKLGCPIKLVLDLQGSCKRELEHYMYEMDFTATYHTTKIKILDNSPMYECVVSSKCLYKTRSNFFVSSDEKTFSDEHSASESAARNALRLLGLEA